MLVNRAALIVLVVSALLVSTGCPSAPPVEPPPPVNRAPVITSLAMVPQQLEPGGLGVVSASVSDADGDALTFSWSADGDFTVTPDAEDPSRATVRAPSRVNESGTLRLEVRDTSGEKATGELVVSTPTNAAPVVTISADRNPTPRGTEIALSALASDPEGDALTFTWSVADPEWTLNGGGANVTVGSPNVYGRSALVLLSVADGFNTVEVSLLVATEPAIPLEQNSSMVVASPVAAGETQTVIVTLRDELGEGVANYPVAVSADGTGNTFSATSGNTDSNGAFSFDFSSTMAEPKTLTASFTGGSLAAAVLVVPGPPHPMNSTFTASPPELPADGTSAATLSLVVLDAFANPVAGASTSLTASGSGNVLTQPGPTDATGASSATLSSTGVGPQSLTAVVDGVTLATQPVVNFVAPYSVGGSVSGLTGTGLVLRNNGADDASILADGAFTFPTKLGIGQAYAVTVHVQPPGQVCDVTNGSGTILDSDVTDVQVKCGGLWSRVSGGEQHSLGVMADGSLWGWGSNSLGQVGDGTTIVRDEPVQIGTGFALVSAGVDHSVAVKQDGTLWAWGSNYSGEVGDGTRTARHSPVQIGAGFVQGSAGRNFTLALKSDGTLWAFGANSYGQLGTGNTTDSLVPVQIGSGFVSVAAGDFHALAVKADGSLWSWGGNDYGQLGDGTNTARTAPAQLGTGFASVAAGANVSLAVKADGSLWSFGRGGEVGDGTSNPQSSPVQIGTGFASVGAGGGHSLGVKTDGTLWAWGGNGFGQLGDGTLTSQLAPIQVGSGFASVEPGKLHSAAVKADGTLWTWGAHEWGQLGNGASNIEVDHERVGSDFTGVAGGGHHSVGLKSDGTLWAWGRGGVLGDGTTTGRVAPVQIGSGFQWVDAGKEHSAGIKADGSLWTWGHNFDGQLGHGDTMPYSSPEKLTQLGSGYAQVAAGDSHTLALMTGGFLYAWGANASGQLGDGATYGRSSPGSVTGSGYASIAAGGQHSLAIKTDGSLWAWGNNSKGQLGDGTTTQRNSPVRIGTGFSHVAAGLSHSVALKTDGTLWAWGDNSEGQLGLGAATSAASPSQIGTGFVSIATGDLHTLALQSDGTLWAVGSNYNGQLGDGTLRMGRSLVQVATGVAVISCGGSHSLAIKTDGTLLSWGKDDYGQLGHGDGAERVPGRIY